MTDDDTDITELVEEWDDFSGEEDAPDSGGGDEDGGDGGDAGEDMGALVQDQFEQMMPENPELMDYTLDDVLADDEEDDDSDDEDEDDSDDGDDATADVDPCYGSSEFSLVTLEEYGDLRVALNYQVADAIQERTVLSSDPSDEQLADLHPALVDEMDEINTDLNSDDFVGSRSETFEVHWDDEDFDSVHAAMARAMHPTEDKLKRDPDAEITPDSLLRVSRKSCHDDYDSCRTFQLSREGSAETFVERGPWTARQFDVDDMIEELRQVNAESDDGIMAVTHVVPFK